MTISGFSNGVVPILAQRLRVDLAAVACDQHIGNVGNEAPDRCQTDQHGRRLVEKCLCILDQHPCQHADSIYDNFLIA